MQLPVYSYLKLACGILTASRNTHCHSVLFLLFYRKRSITLCVCQCQSDGKLQMSLPIKLSRTRVCKDALTLFVLLYFWICLSTANYFNVLQLWAHPSSPLCIAMWDNTLHQNTLKNPAFCIMHTASSSTLQFKLITKSSLSLFVYVTDSHTHLTICVPLNGKTTGLHSNMHPPRPLQLI